MIDVDKYLGETYDFNANNCGHFVARVWKDATGEDIANICQSFISDGQTFVDLLQLRTKLKEPITPCVVIIHQHGSNTPHAGVYIDGSILHLTESGAIYQPIETIVCCKFSFYK